MKKRNILSSLGTVLPVLVSVILVTVFAFSMSALARSSGEEGARRLEENIRLAAMACYAAEGYYPPTLSYLKEHYGITVSEKYAVFYEVFAENLLPEITVVEVKP